jgi:type VI secretion system secreted protein VgrG
MDLPFAMDELDLQLVIGPSTFRVLEAEIEEGLSESTVARVVVANVTDVDFDPLIDERAILIITSKGFPIRTFTMRLGSSTFKGVVDQSLRYALELHPDFYFVKFRRNTRKFRDMKPEDIISKVLGESGVEHEFSNTRACDLRPYTVQYRESDFDFVSRLLEFEGIYYSFSDDGSIQFGDASSSHADIPSVFELLETGGAMADDKPGITSFHRGGMTTSGTSTVNDYNWKTPDVSLLATAANERDADLEVYEYPVGYRQGDQGKVLARLRMEAQTAFRSYAKGTSSVVSFRPGVGFIFVHTEATDFSGRYMLTHVKHKLVTKYASEGQGKYENTWKAIPADVPFRPALVTPHPVIVGNHTAMVRGPEGEEIHTDTWGRAKVQFHWDREAKGTDEDSRWIRVLQETSTSIVLSRVGWEIAVSYIDGDPDRPVGISRQINGQMVPMYTQPSFKNRMTIKTESYPGKQGFNEVRLDDTPGKMVMDMHAQRDFLNQVGNNKTEKIGNDQTRLVKLGFSRSVGNDQKVEVEGNETRQIGETHKTRVKQNRNEKIGGNEQIQAAKTITLTITGNSTESVGGNVTTRVGSVSIHVPGAAELLNTLVGGNKGGLDAGAGGYPGGEGGPLGKLLGDLGKKALQSAIEKKVGKPSKPDDGDKCEYVSELAARKFSDSVNVLEGKMPNTMPLLKTGMSILPKAKSLFGGKPKGGPGGAGNVPGGLSGNAGGGGGNGGGGPGNAGGVPGGLSNAANGGGGGADAGGGGGSGPTVGQDISSAMVGNISKNVDQNFAMSVAGNYVKSAAGQVQNLANENLVEVVGGLKITMTQEENITQSANGRLIRVVGFAIRRKTKDAMSHSAQDSKIVVKKNAKWESKEEFEVRGTEIELEAEEKFRLEIEGAAVELTPQSITIEGSLKLESDGPCNIKGGPDKLSA